MSAYAPNSFIDAVAGAPAKMIRTVPRPTVSKGAPPAAAIWALILVIAAVAIVAFVLIGKKPHPLPLSKSSFQYVAAQTPNTAASLTTTYLGNTDVWSLRVVNNVLQYRWQQGNSIPVTVWDTVNANCGPNLASYNAMVTYLTTGGNTGTVYSNAPGYSATLGVTTTWTNSAGTNIQFRLQLYAGDLRIEAMNATGRFWSIFAPPGNVLPANWPSAVPNGNINIVWAAYSQSAGQLSAFFLQSGELVVQAPFAGAAAATVAWIASVNQPEPFIC